MDFPIGAVFSLPELFFICTLSDLFGASSDFALFSGVFTVLSEDVFSAFVKFGFGRFGAISFSVEIAAKHISRHAAHAAQYLRYEILGFGFLGFSLEFSALSMIFLRNSSDTVILSIAALYFSLKVVSLL